MAANLDTEPEHHLLVKIHVHLRVPQVDRRPIVYFREKLKKTFLFTLQLF